MAARTDTLLPPTDWVVIDPVTTWLAAGLTVVVGSVAAWNLLVLASVVLAFAGGWVLARRVGGDPLTGAVALALAPGFLGSVASGLTEDFAVGVLALALGLVGRAGWRAAVGAGLALGALAWFGLYLALMGAIGASLLGVWTLVVAPARWRELAGAALVASVLAAGALGMQGDRIGGVGHRQGHTVEHADPHWRVNPTRGADVASLFVPGPDVRDDALIRIHPAYLGWVSLAFAAVGWRRGGPWWLILGAAVVVMPGEMYRVLGHPTGVPNPIVSALAAVPGVGLVNHWGRFALLAHTALAALAALGVARLKTDETRTWRVRLGWAAPAAVALEVVVLSAAPVPLPVADSTVPAVYYELDELPPGAVLVVPSAGPGVHVQRSLYRQRAHGRPLSTHPNRPGYGPAGRVPLVRWFAGLPAVGMKPPDPALPQSMASLAGLGIGVIVVEKPWEQQVEALLGPPDVQGPGGAAWSVLAE
jgi:hypothetical protein